MIACNGRLLSFALILALGLTSCDLPGHIHRDAPQPRTPATEPYYGIVGNAISDKYDGILTEIYDAMEFDPELSENQSAKYTNVETTRSNWHGDRVDYTENYDEDRNQWLISYLRDVDRDDFTKSTSAELLYTFRTVGQDPVKDPFARNVYDVVINGTRKGEVQNREIYRESDMRIEGLNDPPYYRIRGTHTSEGVTRTSGRSGEERQVTYTLTLEARDVVIESDVPEDLLYQIVGVWDVTVLIKTERAGQQREFTGRIDLDGSGYAYLSFEEDRRTIRFNALSGERR